MKHLNFLTKTRWLLVPLMLLTLGVGQMWGAKDDVIYCFDGSVVSPTTQTSYANGGGSNTATELNTTGTSTLSKASWKYTWGIKSSSAPAGFWLGTNNNAKANLTLGTTVTECAGIATAIGKTTSDTYAAALICTTAMTNVGKIVVTYGTGGTAPTIDVLYSTNNGTSWTSVGTANPAGTYTFTTIASAKYALVAYGTAWFNLRAPVITFYEGSTGPSCTPITPTLSYTSTDLSIGEDSSNPTLNKDGSSGAITWTSSNTNVATVNSSGVVHAEGTGSTTITATIAAAGGKCSGTATATFNVTRPITYYVGSTEYQVGGVDGNTLLSTLPTSPTSCNTTKYPHFYGWVTSSINGTATSAPTIVSSGNVSAATAGETYYAVFTDAEAVDYSEEYTGNISIGTDGVSINGTTYNGKKVGSSNSGGSITISCPVGTNALAVHAYSWNGADNKTITPSASGVTFTPASATLRDNSGVSSNPPFTINTSNWKNNYFVFEFDEALESATSVTLSLNNQGVFWGVYTISANSSEANYITTCCNELAPINGSFNRIHF